MISVPDEDLVSGHVHLLLSLLPVQLHGLPPDQGHEGEGFMPSCPQLSPPTPFFD